MDSSLDMARTGPFGVLPWTRAASGLVAVASLLATATANAAPRALDIQRERVRVLESQVVTLDASARAVQARYATSRGRLTSVRDRIRTNTRDLANAVADRATAEQRLATRISSLYRRRQPTVFEAVITAVNITDAVNGWGLLGRVATQDATAVRSIVGGERRIRELRTNLIVDRREARARFSETKTAFERVERVRSARRVLLSGARAQLAVFITAEQRRQAAVAAAQTRQVAPVAPSGPGPQATPSSSSPSAAPTATGVTAVLNRIAQCESGGSITAVSPSGQYRGKYQFDPGIWRNLGGKGDPAQAPEAEQDRVAAKLYAASGAAPWPVCGRFAR
ncbi:MAG: transglycosylase family protein [Actinobacteria bacterium]|nr:transglycosylase family protein [Actinomycetota bacterium]